MSDAAGAAMSNGAQARPAQAAPVGWNKLSAERDFYAAHPWSLNVFPRIRDIVGFLSAETALLDQLPADWRFDEARANVFLLACAISDTVDEWLLGDRYDFSKISGVVPGAGLVLKPVGAALAFSARVRTLRARRLQQWREEWELALGDYLLTLVAGPAADPSATRQSAVRLLSLLDAGFPPRLAARRAKVPAAFRSQDLAHFDLLALGAKLAAEFPDRSRPILVLGFRTAGSYFAPLLRAWLKSEGYQDVDSVTIRPKNGAAPREAAKLARIAARSGLTVIVDEPINTGGTAIAALALLKNAGIPADRLVALLPVHPTRRDWNRGYATLPLNRMKVITLEPEEFYKSWMLGAESGTRAVRAYFEHNGRTVHLISEEECLNAALADLSEQKFHNRLKRVYEVRLIDQEGRPETHYVLAKSVGWGWLSYHAFLAGERLCDFVPPVLGLRHGILYTEWLPQRSAAAPNGIVPVAAEYIAARARHLRLDEDPAPDLARAGQHKGLEELAGVLSRAYGSKIASALRRPRTLAGLMAFPAPMPTLVDGKMRPIEWIEQGLSIRKTDFEHHGQGKTELNIADPAYDLAETILHWRLAPDQERQLVRRYAELAGDIGIHGRLFLSKLLAGAWAIERTLDNLKDPRLSLRHADFNKRYLEALDFLVEHTTRHCGQLCTQPGELRWNAPLVVADVDGVLDKQIFGYPSTTAAGIQAISLLHAHGIALALNTARSLAQVKVYCEAYGCVGGIAEYGSVAWDVVGGSERVLVGQEALGELDQVRRSLRSIPGVFLNENYQYSIRAYLFERGTTVPLPSIMIRDLMAGLKVDRLDLHQTFTDTTIIARETDKGRGLLELLSLSGHAGIDTFAIGDSQADLPMFQAATRGFAPSHISCRRAAQLFGCRIASRSYQSGLLEIVRSIVHPDGRPCDACRAVERALGQNDDRFLAYLKIADRPWWSHLFGALLDPKSLGAFRA